MNNLFPGLSGWLFSMVASLEWTLLETSLTLPFLKGQHKSSLHFNLRFGYYGSFTSGLLCSLTGFMVVLFFFKETKKPSTDEGKSVKTSLISLKNFSDSFKVLMKKRAGHVRHVVVLLVGCMLVGWSPLLYTGFLSAPPSPGTASTSSTLGRSFTLQMRMT